jgi:hypothetical protein
MSRKMRALPASFAALAAVFAREARAYCPSYTPASAFNDHDCAIQAYNGENPSVAEWNSIFELVSQGPTAWGSLGPPVKDIGQGCGKPEPLHSVPARFPCELLKAIAKNESGWRQFCVPDMPADQVGGSPRTVISFDCGYGAAQVTTGMHQGESPDFDRDRVAKEPTYNLATGTRILAQIWAQAKCVGDNQPAIIEDWYNATWAYNGLAYVNNPNNPNYDANRGVWDPKLGGGAPYQERIFGFIEHTGGQWAPTELAYPNPGDVGNDKAPGTLPEPSCASPTDCTKTRGVHKTACEGAIGTGGAGPGTGGTSGAGGDDDAGSPNLGAGGAGAGAGGAGGAGGEAEPTAIPGCACRIGAARDPSGMAGIWLWAAGLLSLLRRRKAP